MKDNRSKFALWIQRSWRPITILVLVFLIAAHWLGYLLSQWFGFKSPDLEEVQGLTNIVAVGLGTYVLGRSGEKIVTTWKQKQNVRSG